MFVIVCWFSSICVARFCWKISSEISSTLPIFGGLLTRGDFLLIVTVSQATLSIDKGLLLNSSILTHLCFFSPSARGPTVAVNQSFH